MRIRPLIHSLSLMTSLTIMSACGDINVDGLTDDDDDQEETEQGSDNEGPIAINPGDSQNTPTPPDQTTPPPQNTPAPGKDKPANPGLELVAGESYSAGQTVAASSQGVQFTIPLGFSAYAQGDNLGIETVLLTSSQTQGQMILTVSQDTPAEVEQELGDLIELSEGIILQPLGSVRRTENSIAADYGIQGNPNGAATLMMVFGPYGRNLLIIAVYPSPEASMFLQSLQNVRLSAEFFSP